MEVWGFPSVHGSWIAPAWCALLLGATPGALLLLALCRLMGFVFSKPREFWRAGKEGPAGFPVLGGMELASLSFKLPPNPNPPGIPCQGEVLVHGEHQAGAGAALGTRQQRTGGTRSGTSGGKCAGKGPGVCGITTPRRRRCHTLIWFGTRGTEGTAKPQPCRPLTPVTPAAPRGLSTGGAGHSGEGPAPPPSPSAWPGGSA